jgi:hypothetical protein
MVLLAHSLYRVGIFLLSRNPVVSCLARSDQFVELGMERRHVPVLGVLHQQQDKKYNEGTDHISQQKPLPWEGKAETHCRPNGCERDQRDRDHTMACP